MDGLKEKMFPVMLPTEKATGLILSSGKELMLAPYNTKWKPEGDSICQHLYICSNREIKEGDCAIVNGEIVWKHIVVKPDSVHDWKKIAASTDKSLGLPEPSKEFIEAYIKAHNSGTPITEVMVDMEEYYPDFDDEEYDNWDNNKPHLTFKKVKLKPDNTITITKVMETWDDIKQQLYSDYPYLKKDNEDIEFVFEYFINRRNPPTKIK